MVAATLVGGCFVYCLPLLLWMLVGIASVLMWVWVVFCCLFDYGFGIAVAGCDPLLGFVGGLVFVGLRCLRVMVDVVWVVLLTLFWWWLVVCLSEVVGFRFIVWLDGLGDWFDVIGLIYCLWLWMWFGCLVVRAVYLVVCCCERDAGTGLPVNSVG